jgi:hypothetical protein
MRSQFEYARDNILQFKNNNEGYRETPVVKRPMWADMLLTMIRFGFALWFFKKVLDMV